MLTFYGYPQCGTCRKAQKWLKDHELDFDLIHIVESPPSRADLETLVEKSGQPITAFFNTSGQSYRDLGLKDKIKEATRDEQLNWLASDGKLIKRPIVTDGNRVTVGFKEDIFTKTWLS